jgi:hypothetical protein
LQIVVFAARFSGELLQIHAQIYGGMIILPYLLRTDRLLRRSILRVCVPFLLSSLICVVVRMGLQILWKLIVTVVALHAWLDVTGVPVAKTTPIAVQPLA